MVICLFLCLSVMGMHCDHMVHISPDLSLWLDSPMFWAPWHQSMSTYFQPSFPSFTWKRGGVWMCKLGVIPQERLKIEVKLLLSANRKLYMPHLAQQRLTLSDLEWLFYTSCTISAVAKLLASVNSDWKYRDWNLLWLFNILKLTFH